MTPVGAIHYKAAELGKLGCRMTTLAGSGHPSSSLSIAHLVTTLMYRVMRYDPANPWHPTADRLVLSEGHAVPIVYAALADLGGAVGVDRGNPTKLTIAELDQLRARDSVLDGHPNPAEGMPFFDAATGSLGMGLSVAAGLALAARLDESPRRVFCLIGDGESREGQIWEAADFIADHKLNSVCAIFNANGEGQAAHVSGQQSAERLAAKLTAFGWDAVVIDGHDPAAIETALAGFGGNQRPFAIVARTVKGWGVDLMTNKNFHGKPLAEAELPATYESLDRKVKALGGATGELGRPSVPATAKEPVRPDPREVKWPAFAEALGGVGLEGALKKNAVATRRAYGAALKTAGDVLPQIAVLDADVSNSTFSEMFAKHHPQRFIECKIAEQNMVSAAVGLAAAGFIPFANSFAKFIARAYDQVELANIGRANVKLVGSHAGISLAADGPSQMAVVDVAFFRALGSVRGDDRRSPQCWFFQPADAVAAYQLTRTMVEHRGLCYMRTHRPDVPLLYAPDARFEPGDIHMLQPGDDLALISSGYMVHVAKDAAGLLAKQGLRAALIDAYSLPLNGAKLREILDRSGGLAVVVEDNYGGGLGAAVAEAVAESGKGRVRSVFCQRMPKSTRGVEEILEYCGVSAQQIADQSLALIKKPV